MGRTSDIRPFHSPHLAVWRVLFSLWLTVACVFALPRTSHAQTFNSLFSFGGPDEAANPIAGLIQASDGNLYGTTYYGGANGVGAVFQIKTDGTVTTLYSFTGGTDGANPLAGLIQASDGNLYGTTSQGGANSNGTVFRITTTGQLKTLHGFSAANSYGTNTDGANPRAGLIQASDGNLYGTTSQGGANSSGTVFCITTSGALTTLHSFDPVVAGPHSLIQASDGNLYGTTVGNVILGGYGTVFLITTGGAFTELYYFGPHYGTIADGIYPEAGLIQAGDGNLYGTTSQGGANGNGTVFRITTGGKLKTLHSFSGGTDGAYPAAGLIQAGDGNLYGTTSGEAYPASSGFGTVFRITTGGKLKTLHSFSGGTDGANPTAGLIQASDANLYGTTYGGGDYSLGTLFSVDIALALTSLSPSTANAAGPMFTLTLKGNLFDKNTSVNWTQGATTTALTTTFVSSIELKAAVPASLIANAGTAAVTVTNESGNRSNGETFTILLTTLKLSSAKLTVDSTGNYTAKISIKNAGNLTAPGVTITQATLGTAASSTTLPVSLGSIAKGKTGSASLIFPSTAGSSGTTVTLNLTGTFTGGTFTGLLKVKLP